MSRNYTLNPEHAKQAGVSNRIDSTGKYAGKFTRAEAIFSKEGTEGVEFTFESTDGRNADFLTCWTFNKDGKELYGLKVLNALMTCMRVKEINAQPGLVEDHKGNKKSAEIFPALMSKQIGILLQREDYKKQDGDIGYKFNIVGCFEASTELTAKEILEKITKPVQLEKMVSMLRDKPLSNKTAQRSATQSPSSHEGAFDDFKDDIPF